MTFALARSLLLADAVTPTALAEALFLSATRGTSLVRTLLAARAIDTLRLEQMLERGEAPYMRHIAPVPSLVDRLPPGLCNRLLAIPVRHDPRTGTVDVAVVDARDSHPAEEIGHWLNAPVRIVRTSIASMESALLRLGGPAPAEPDLGLRSLAPPIWSPAPSPSFPPPPRSPVASELLRTPMYGSRAFDAGSFGGTDAARGTGGRASPGTDPEAEDPDLAIPLTRRNFAPEAVVERAIVAIGPPAIERERRRGDTDPILDLKRLKPSKPRLEDAERLETGDAEAAGPATPGRGALGREAPDDPESAPEPTVRGPFPPPAAPTTPSLAAAAAAPVASVLDAMREARDWDQILDLLVSGTRSFAARAAVFAVRRDSLAGWTGSGEIAERADLRAVRLLNSMPTVFHQAVERESARLARIPMDAAHTPLLSVMRSPPAGQVVIAAVQADGKAVAVIFADGLAEPALAIERIGALARAAGESLGRLLREKRR